MSRRRKRKINELSPQALSLTPYNSPPPPAVPPRDFLNRLLPPYAYSVHCTPFSLTAESEMELREGGGGNFFLIRPLPKSKAMVKAKEIFPLLPFSRRRGRKQKNRILPRLEFPWVTGESNRGERHRRNFPVKNCFPFLLLHAAKELGHVRRKVYFSFSQIRIISS